jgi:hypothetical protein
MLVVGRRARQRRRDLGVESEVRRSIDSPIIGGQIDA